MPKLPQQQSPLGPKRHHKPKLSPWTKPSTCGTLTLHKPTAATWIVPTIHAEDKPLWQDTTRTVHFKNQNNNTKTMILSSMTKIRARIPQHQRYHLFNYPRTTIPTTVTKQDMTPTIPVTNPSIGQDATSMTVQLILTRSMTQNHQEDIDQNNYQRPSQYAHAAFKKDIPGTTARDEHRTETILLTLFPRTNNHLLHQLNSPMNPVTLSISVTISMASSQTQNSLTSQKVPLLDMTMTLR